MDDNHIVCDRRGRRQGNGAEAAATTAAATAGTVPHPTVPDGSFEAVLRAAGVLLLLVIFGMFGAIARL